MTTVDEMVSELFGPNSRDVERVSRCHELHARAPARASTIIIAFQRCALPSDELLPGRGRCAVYLAPSKMSCDRPSIYVSAYKHVVAMVVSSLQSLMTATNTTPDSSGIPLRVDNVISVTKENSKHLKKTQRS